jgi:hypothetical protein
MTSLVSAVRVVLAGTLVLISVALLLFGLVVLSNLFADYKDSPDATYILIGRASIGLAAMAAAGAFACVVRFQPAVSLVAALALPLSLVPYSRAFGDAAWVANVSMAFVFLAALVAWLSLRGRRGSA